MLVALAACGKDAPRGEPATPPAPPAPRVTAADQLRFDDLGQVLRAILPDDARVIGFGELHARTDRAQVESALARFTAEGLPAIADKLSDLVVETWLVDKTCGKPAEEATAKIAITTRRPQQTHSEIGALAEAARKAGIQPHAMKLTCEDYTRISPPDKDVDPVEMLTVTTRELGRIASEAVAHRDGEATHKPWIAVYGGALHNDRFPDAGVAEWSYAAKLDAATHGHFVEVDLIVPELAEADAMSQKQPWFELVKSAGKLLAVWKRGERSFVVVLPRTKA